jgi:hypothetical protein
VFLTRRSSTWNTSVSHHSLGSCAGSRELPFRGKETASPFDLLGCGRVLVSLRMAKLGSGARGAEWVSRGSDAELLRISADLLCDGRRRCESRSRDAIAGKGKKPVNRVTEERVPRGTLPRPLRVVSQSAPVRVDRPGNGKNRN